MSALRSGAALALVLAACTAPVLELPPPRPRGQPVALPPSPSVAAGRAKPARVIVIGGEDELVSGSEADGRRGDLRLDNGLVAFVVSAPGSAIGFAESGGNVVDAVPLGGCGGRTCRDALKQVMGYLADTFPRQPVYDRVEPGSRGSAAVVRAFGHDSQNPSLAVETEYALAPGSNALELVTTVTNHGTVPIAGYQVGDAIAWGRAERFTPGHGLEQPAPPSREVVVPEGWLAGLADEVSYVYVGDDPAGLRGRHDSAWSNLNLTKTNLPPGGSAHVRRWLVVGAAGDPTIGDTVARLRGQAWSRLEGRVTEEGSDLAIEGARVYLDDAAGKPRAFARSADGRYAAVVPPGDYFLRAEARGQSGPSRVAVELRAGQPARKLDLVMKRPGSLRYRVTEGGKPSPAKLTFLGAGETRAPNFGPSFSARGRDVVLTVDGQGTVELPPGSYHVLASRGPEFGTDLASVEIVSGRESEVELTLERAVDTHGYLCVDLHQHAAPSADSGVSLRDRAASNLAEGMEVLVATDHNMIADWQPTIAALGATRPLRVVYGDEATLDGTGHWNAYPVRLRADQPRGGALDVRGLDAHKIVAGLRASESDGVVQVNHPRAGLLGYFSIVKLDSRPGAPLPVGWEGGFDAIEVLSSKDPTTAEAALRDWYALLNRGLKYTAVGGSDSYLVWGQEVGYPRSCVGVGDYDVQRPGPALAKGIKERRDVLVTNGPFVRVSVGGYGMGQLAPAPRGKARLDVEVHAAPWVSARKLDVLVDGERRGKPIDLPSEPGKALHWKGSVELKVSEDAYVTVEVRGEESLAPVLAQLEGAPPPMPFAFTNPIYLDRDLDGKYTLPGKR